MNLLKFARRGLGGAAAIALLTTAYGASAAPTPIPISALSHDPAFQSATLSPDGKSLAALTSGPGKPINLSIWRTDALDKPPVVLGMGPVAARANLRFFEVTWVSNDRLLVLAQQPLTVGSGDESRDFTYIARIVDREGKEWIEPLKRGGTKSEDEDLANKFLRIRFMGRIPGDPNHILLRYSDFRRGSTDVYKVDVRDGSGERVARAGGDESFTTVVDNQGRPRVKEYVELVGSDWTVGHRIFNPDKNAWEEHPALSYPIKNRRGLQVQAFDPDDPNLLLVIDNQDTDLTAVKGYDIKKRAFVETLFAHPKFEAAGAVIAHDAEDKPTVIEGFAYQGPVTAVYWLDPKVKAVEDSLKQQFPGQNINFLDNRFDSALRLIEVSSSINPPTYYLLRNDRELLKIGASRAEVDSSQLAPTQLIYYAARDGLQIPGFLSLPKGFDKSKGPIPTIIMPHGGPWSRDTADWDQTGWVPFLTSRGYAVLQPQYRGSEGWGDKLWKAGDREWGQKMQDDKDDGVKYLVDQGIADPKRVAIFGYSYGGFAAIAAAARPNGVYKCAIAGAGVSDLTWAHNTWGESRVQRQMQGDTVGGMNPLANVDKVDIPMLVYAGDRDQTVPIVQSRQWVRALKAKGKSVEYVEVKDMPHSLPWWPAWQEETLAAIEGFLNKGCAGGL